MERLPEKLDIRKYAGGLVRYDATRKRVWIAGQRMHHGLWGLILTYGGLAGLAARRVKPAGGVTGALFGTALMAHDWHDRSVWLMPGSQEHLG